MSSATPRAAEASGKPATEHPVRSIGLALAGGGVLAAAHVGVMRALAEVGITVAVAAGVSAGALIAALWADGKSWEDLLRLSQRLSFGILDVNLGALLLPWQRQRLPGVFVGGRLERRLQEFLSVQDLADLAAPCALVTADLLTGQPVVFASRPAAIGLESLEDGGPRPEWRVGGPAAKLLRGSMAVPVLFPPVPHDGRLLVDGGVIDHVPAWAVRALGADFVIGVDLTSWDVPEPREACFSPLGVGARALRLSQRFIRVGAGADVVITPEFPSNSSILDFRRLEEHYEAGYRAGLAALPRVREGLRAAAPA